MSGEKGHALLSASSAEKWMNCNPSARTEEPLPESESGYADEGKLAHEIAELKVRKAFLDPMPPKSYSKRMQALKADPRYQEEMQGYTDIYLDHVSQVVHSFSSPPYIALERRLDYSEYAPEGFGTGDCIIIGGSTLHVIDFKYGKGVPVSAVENPQMLLYALGALAEFNILYPIETIILWIVQPRLENLSRYELSVTDLLAFGEKVKPIALRAFKGEGEFVPGAHCRFCRAKSLCRARCETHTALEDFGMKLPPLLTNEEVAQILQRAQNLAAWVKNLEDYALGECLAGRDIPGWKAVEGRSVRQFSNTDEAFAVLIKAGYEEAMLYERKPATLTAVESLLGKSRFNELLSTFVNKAPGKPALALSSDKREAITRTSAQQDFGTPEAVNH